MDSALCAKIFTTVSPAEVPGLLSLSVMADLFDGEIMQAITVPKGKFSSPALCCLLIIFNGLAGEVTANDYTGPAFSDPANKVTTLPLKWQQQPVQHDKQNNGSDLVVSLDQQMYPTLKPLIEKFSKKHNLSITVRDGTCGLSSGLLLKKSIDIGGYCCPPGKNDRLPGLQFHTLAVAPIALITHASNPLENVTLEQARAIYRGRIQHWSNIDPGASATGTSDLVKPIGRLHCKTRPGHWRLLLKNQNQFGVRLREVGAIPDMVSEVASGPAAIGYETTWMAKHHAEKGKIKILKIDGISAYDTKALAEGKYPMYRTYSLAVWTSTPARKPNALKLVDFLADEIGRLDPEYGLVATSELRRHGWKFSGPELTGSPEIH